MLIRALKWTLVSAGLFALWLALFLLREILGRRFNINPEQWQIVLLLVFRPLFVVLAIDLALIVKRRIRLRTLPLFIRNGSITVRTYVSVWFALLFPLVGISFGYARWTLPAVLALTAADLAILAGSRPQGARVLAHYSVALGLTALVVAYGFVPSVLVVARNFRKPATVQRCVGVEYVPGLRPVFAFYRHLRDPWIKGGSAGACPGDQIFDPYRFIYDELNDSLLISFESQRQVVRLPLDDPSARSGYSVINQSSYPALNDEDREVYVSAWKLRQWFTLDADTLELEAAHAFPSEGPWATAGAKLLVYDPVGDALILSNESAELMRYSFESGSFTHRVKYMPGMFHIEVSLLLYPEQRLGILVTGFDRGWPFMGAVYRIDLDDLSTIDSRNFFEPIAEGSPAPELGGVLLSMPVSGRVMLLDPRTLEIHDSYLFSQGVRALAYDPRRGLIIGGNYLNGMLQIYSIDRRRIVDEFFAGLLIRSCIVIPERDELYIGSECGIFAYDLSRYDYPGSGNKTPDQHGRAVQRGQVAHAQP